MVKSQHSSSEPAPETAAPQPDPTLLAVGQAVTDYAALALLDKAKAALMAMPGTATLLEYLRTRTEGVEDESAAVWESIASEIFSATTADEVLSGGTVMGAEDVLDVPLVLHRVEYRASDMADGIPYYAVLHVTHHGSDKPFVLTCGGVRVVMQVVKLELLGALPYVIVFKEAAKPTKNGYRPLRLETMPF